MPGGGGSARKVRIATLAWGRQRAATASGGAKGVLSQDPKARRA